MSYPATCTPEEMGLPSDAVIDFLDYVEESRINLYSFMLIKDGKTVTEAYYKPFDASSKHRIYSCTKSVSALAVGLLLKDGLVDDGKQAFDNNRYMRHEYRNGGLRF